MCDLEGEVMSGLQEVVGQPGMTLEEAQEDERVLRARLKELEVSSVSTRPSPCTQGSGSSSASGAPTKVKKHIDKNRTLLRGHSDGDSARNLMESFDCAADMQQADDDEDEELITNEHMQRSERERATQASRPRWQRPRRCRRVRPPTSERGWRC